MGVGTLLAQPPSEVDTKMSDRPSRFAVRNACPIGNSVVRPTMRLPNGFKKNVLVTQSGINPIHPPSRRVQNVCYSQYIKSFADAKSAEYIVQNLLTHLVPAHLPKCHHRRPAAEVSTQPPGRQEHTRTACQWSRNRAVGRPPPTLRPWPTPPGPG